MRVKPRQRRHLAAVYSRPERLEDELIPIRTEGERFSQIELDPDSKSMGTDDAVVHAEEGFSPRSKHCRFNSRTHEKADFILNHVHLHILTARLPSLFSFHLLEALTGVKTVKTFIHCITLALREFVFFDSTRLDFFAHFLCDLIGSRILIKKNDTEVKSTRRQDELERMRRKLMC
jgi:hypothetical protein